MGDRENNAAAGWRKQTIIVIEGAAGPGDPVVDKTETSHFSEEEPGETTITSFRHADGCGHVIHTAAEVGAISACGRVLCQKCSENICHRCGKPVCGEHMRRAKKEETELIYCWRCWPWRFLEDWGEIARWIVGGLLVLLVLKSLAGC